jgi:hypothetical protein
MLSLPVPLTWNVIVPSFSLPKVPPTALLLAAQGRQGAAEVHGRRHGEDTAIGGSTAQVGE